MTRFLLIIAAALGLAAYPVSGEARSGGAEAENCAACEAVLELALANPRRQNDRDRDAWRHPAETLAFFRVRPGMTVVDYVPGGGWYTRILVPYLGEHGHYIGLNPAVSGASEQLQKNFGNLAQTFPGQAAGWTGVPAETIGAYNSDSVPASLKGKVDRVLIFRWMHNLQRTGMLVSELATVRTLLKPRGLLGIEQHRARPDAPDAYVDGTKGYLREADIVAMVEAQGFKLVGRSEVNANPRDSADHEAGVWALPPSFRQGDTDREKFAAIGESDRMTLLFRKRP